MGTAAVSNTFVNGALADADEMNANFSSILSFINSETVHTDGSNDMGGALTLGADGSNPFHAVTFRQYDGGPAALQVQGLALEYGGVEDIALTADSTERWGDQNIAFANPGRQVTLKADLTGYFRTTGAGGQGRWRLAVSIDGGATYTTYQSPLLAVTVNATADYVAVAANLVVPDVTPTGEVRVRALAYQASGTIGSVRSVNGYLTAMMVPS